MRKYSGIILFGFVFSLLAVYSSFMVQPGPAYAGMAISVTGVGGTTWLQGPLGMGAIKETTGGKLEITIFGDTATTVYVKVDELTGTNPWHPAAAIGIDTFVLKHKVVGEASWSSDITSVSNGIKLFSLRPAGSATYTEESFDLQLQAPTSSTADVEHTMTVTLTASAHDGTPFCDGYYYGGECWYMGPTNNSCTGICSAHGGSSGCKLDDTSCTIQKHWFPSSSCNIYTAYGPGWMPAGDASNLYTETVCTTWGAGINDSRNRLCACAQ